MQGVKRWLHKNCKLILYDQKCVVTTQPKHWFVLFCKRKCEIGISMDVTLKNLFWNQMGEALVNDRFLVTETMLTVCV